MNCCILLKIAYTILIRMYHNFPLLYTFSSESVHKIRNNKHCHFSPRLSNRMMHVFPTFSLVITENMWAVNHVFYPPVPSRMK